jgi:hypothetical protein
MVNHRFVRAIRMLPALLALAGLAGCGTWAAPVAAVGVASFGAVPLIQRTSTDAVVSLVTGRDCSVVRLDKQESYCKEREMPRPQPYCTRSLGVVDCWIDPQAIPQTPPPVADAPDLTAAQEKYRRASWFERETGL